MSTDFMRVSEEVRISLERDTYFGGIAVTELRALADKIERGGARVMFVSRNYARLGESLRTEMSIHADDGVTVVLTVPVCR